LPAKLIHPLSLCVGEHPGDAVVATGAEGRLLLACGHLGPEVLGRDLAGVETRAKLHHRRVVCLPSGEPL
jgi:hypothetical protein